MEKINIQIIDDGSEERLYKLLDSKLIEDMGISIYRVIEDIPWNIPGVRNLGAKVASSEWVLFCDMDQFFLKRDMSKLLRLLDRGLDEKNYYSFQRLNGVRTAGTMMLTQNLFWKAGGYDEDLVGNYGHNDPLFRLQLNSIGSKEIILKKIICQQIEADCQLSRDGNNINLKKLQKKKNNLPKPHMNALNFSWEKEC